MSDGRVRRAAASCLVLVLLVVPVPAESRDTGSGAKQELEVLIDWLLDPSREMDEVPFRTVVHATTGYTVLALDASLDEDRRVLDAVSQGLDMLLAGVADPAHPIHSVGRINEVGGQMEDVLQQLLDAMPGIRCEYPPTAAGRVQRSGYPDLMITDEASGRVYFLDPKVFREGSEHSTFRTFYYEPKRETSKINHDAVHLLVGLSHAGFEDGRWIFTGWRLVDLHDFRVRLKAEFQASNRDLYDQNLIVRESANKTE